MDIAFKRFLVFGTEEHPDGFGWQHFLGSFDSAEKAYELLKEHKVNGYADLIQAQIIDLVTGAVEEIDNPSISLSYED